MSRRLCIFRHPRHIGVNRADAAARQQFIEDGVTIKVSPNDTPNAWDDIVRGGLYDRNWKRHRLTRWRQCKSYPRR